MKSKVTHLFGMVCAALAGFYIFSYALGFVGKVAVLAAPWAVVGIMQLPLSYCIQAIFKINEAPDHTSLSPSELRRLTPKIKSKRRNMVLLLCFYVLSTIFVILGFLASTSDQSMLFWLLKISGALLLASLYTSIFVHEMMVELQDFKAQLNRRESERKDREALLDKLK